MSPSELIPAIRAALPELEKAEPTEPTQWLVARLRDLLAGYDERAARRAAPTAEPPVQPKLPKSTKKPD